jgi:hypothetical protein
VFLTADLLRFEFVSFANTADATAKIRGTLGVRIALTHQDDIARTVGLRLVTGVHAGLRPSRGPPLGAKNQPTISKSRWG